MTPLWFWMVRRARDIYARLVVYPHYLRQHGDPDFAQMVVDEWLEIGRFAFWRPCVCDACSGRLSRRHRWWGAMFEEGR